MGRYLLTIFTFLLVLVVSATPENEGKNAFAKRVASPPKINGVLDDPCWKNADEITGFRQFSPDYDQRATQSTVVYILYDNEAVYVGALLKDTAPDSILMQLGNRDDNHLNADWFAVEFDTYSNQFDAYLFKVTASGVQIDRRRRDHTYDAVWKSAVKITDEGWVAEMKIPWSALRFPKEKEQTWGLQLTRNIRRYRETDQWALVVKGVPNQLVYWGTLSGLKDIRPPVRLSLTPYFSIAGQYDQKMADPAERFSYSFGGGADIKYGINESFTVDMTLYPDFSQVKSDNKVKNLSAFETVYAEHRPFFKESVDLFKKGDLFYSRRIGATPSGFYAVPYQIDADEHIAENPSRARLLNAFKFSGRNKHGLAIGVLNALTNNTFAVVEDSAQNKRKILTEPLTNSNITVFDQTLRNNSSVYLINTNVIRSQKGNNANVTGAGVSLLDRQNKWNAVFSGAVSQVFVSGPDVSEYSAKRGYKYYLNLAKVSGNFKFNVYRNVMDARFDANDLGLTRKNNFVQNGGNIRYSIYEPVWYFRNLYASLGMVSETDFTTGKNLGLLFGTNLRVTFLNYLTGWFDFSFSPGERYDYYDPRTEGRYFIRPAYAKTKLGFSSDYRKPFAMDGSLRYEINNDTYNKSSLMIRPVIRVNDKLNFNYTFKTGIAKNNKGYADRDTSGVIIYGRRDLTSYESALSGRYMFRNNLSLSLWMRYFTYQGIYDKYYSLTDDGRLEENNNYQANNDFNFNTFNLDLMFNWEFAPGSNLSVVWKNSILSEDKFVNSGFLDNLKRTINADQLNLISVKVLYYIDYQSLFRHKT